MKIKYIKNLDSIDKNTVFYSREFKMHSNSLEHLLSKISKSLKYKIMKNKYSYLEIEISCKNSVNKKPYFDILSNGIDVYQAKNMLSKSAINRSIIISSSLDEIYTECIEIYLGEYCSVTSYFDYGILYGNYGNYIGACVKSDYYKNETFLSKKQKNSVDSVYFKISSLVHDSSSIIFNDDMENGIYCMYTGTLYDSDNNHIKDYGTIDEPIPVSTFKL